MPNSGVPAGNITVIIAECRNERHCQGFPINSSDDPSAADDSEEHRDDRDHKEEMDQSACSESDKSYCPGDDKDHGDKV